MTAALTPDEEDRIKKPKYPVEALVFGCAVVVSLIWRLVAIPLDDGGWFFHGFGAVVVLWALEVYARRLQGRRRMIVSAILLLAGLFVVFGSIYFVMQCVFPVTGVVFVALGVTAWCKTERGRRIVIVIALISSAGYMIGAALPQIRWIARLRGLAEGQVRQMRIVVPGNAQPIVIEDRNAVGRIAAALRHTSPYTAGHGERIRQKRTLTIHLVNGSAIEVWIGKGNRYYPDTVWLGQGDGSAIVYQNAALYRVFRDVLPDLWSPAP